MSSERSGSDAFGYSCMGRHFRFFTSLHRECGKYNTSCKLLVSDAVFSLFVGGDYGASGFLALQLSLLQLQQLLLHISVEQYINSGSAWGSFLLNMDRREPR